jgi:sporulation protein YlmC with PRC-barrel domain
MKNLLTQVHKDMSVYDRTGKKIGSVENVQFGDEDLERPGVETSTAQALNATGNDLVEDLAKALKTEEQVPLELRKRLLRYGYIKVDTGILKSDRYASADQIARVTADRIDLDVTMNELIAV